MNIIFLAIACPWTKRKGKRIKPVICINISNVCNLLSLFPISHIIYMFGYALYVCINVLIADTTVYAYLFLRLVKPLGQQVSLSLLIYITTNGLLCIYLFPRLCMCSIYATCQWVCLCCVCKCISNIMAGRLGTYFPNIHKVHINYTNYTLCPFILLYCITRRKLHVYRYEHDIYIIVHIKWTHLAAV